MFAEIQEVQVIHLALGGVQARATNHIKLFYHVYFDKGIINMQGV